MKNQVISYYIENLMNQKNNSIFKSKKLADFIKENYDKIISEVPRTFFLDVVESLYQYKELKDFMDEKFTFNMEKANKYEVVNICKIYLKNKSEKEKDKFLTERIPQLIEQINEDNIYYYLELKNLDSKIKNQLNRKIKENKKKYIKDYILGRTYVYYAYLNDDMLYLLEGLIEEILEHENLDWIDIDYIDSGGFSSVFKIGSKILKFGEERNTYRIPYDKRILQPLIRTNLSDLSSPNSNAIENRGVIEVCEMVDTNIEVSEEELYSLYKEVRDRGIILADIKLDNVGRLLKDNNRYWNKELGKSKRAVGYIEDEDFSTNDEVLKAGELVIIDSDYIYYENDPYIEWGDSLAAKFEDRYKLEKNRSK